MSSSSKALASLLGALALWAPAPADALNVYGVYVTACERHLGVILKVERSKLTMVTLAGDTVEVPRYEILSLTYYPTIALPAAELRIGEAVKTLEVKTLQRDAVQTLVSGFPTDFSSEKIAFLTYAGEESLLDRDSIWLLVEQPTPPRITVENPETARPHVFMHPYAAGFCETQAVTEGAQVVYPQQYLNDEIVIKKELDRQQHGHEVVAEYLRDQQFYPVPQLYVNETSLGLWTSAGSRHGASKSRLNNLTPILTDNLSLGPFGYQHTFMTGSAPMSFSAHEEPQVQAYYRFKAAYFHLSAMFDPNLILVGSRYVWRQEDLPAPHPDDRANELFFLELGFDYGRLALQFAPAALTNTAVRMGGDSFRSEVLTVPRGGVRYEDRRALVELWYGREAGLEPWETQMARINVTYKGETLRVTTTVIGRTVAFAGEEFDNLPPYEGKALVGALYVDWALSHKYSLGAFGSLEYRESRASTTTSRWHPKGGVSAALRF